MPKQPHPAATAICKGFVFSTWLTMAAMLVSRIIWMRWIWFSTRQDGREADAPEVGHSLPLGFGYEIEYFEPSLLFCLIASAALLLLIYFGRDTIQTRPRALSFALRCLFFYSAAMIFIQIVFISVVTPSRDERFFFNTAFKHNGTQIVGFDDPHYVTLIISIVALLLLVDRDIFTKLSHVLRRSDKSPSA